MTRDAAMTRGSAMIRGAIFDLDGTLLDSMGIWDSIPGRFLESKGITPREDLNDSLKNLSMRQACELMHRDYVLPVTVDEMIDEAVALADDFYRHEVRLKPGAEAFLDHLQQKGVKMCIATAGDKRLALAALERNGAGKYFNTILTCNELGCGKEDPLIYRIAAEQMGLDKKEIMVFEDSLHALQTAKKDGFCVTAVYDEYEINQAELRAAADHYIENYMEVMQIIAAERQKNET